MGDTSKKDKKDKKEKAAPAPESSAAPAAPLLAKVARFVPGAPAAEAPAAESRKRSAPEDSAPPAAAPDASDKKPDSDAAAAPESKRKNKVREWAAKLHAAKRERMAEAKRKATGRGGSNNQAPLPDVRSLALDYLRLWASSRGLAPAPETGDDAAAPVWKFQKVRQLYLLNNCMNEDLIGKSDFKLFLAYIGDLSGGARLDLLSQAEAVVALHGSISATKDEIRQKMGEALAAPEDIDAEVIKAVADLKWEDPVLVRVRDRARAAAAEAAAAAAAAAAETAAAEAAAAATAAAEAAAAEAAKSAAAEEGKKEDGKEEKGADGEKSKKKSFARPPAPKMEISTAAPEHWKAKSSRKRAEKIIETLG